MAQFASAAVFQLWHLLFPIVLQFCVATIIQSPVCPTELPGACRTQRHGLLDEFRPYGAGIVPVPYQSPQSGHSRVAVFHQSPFVNGFFPNHGLQPPSKSWNSWPLATEGSQATSWLPWETPYAAS